MVKPGTAAAFFGRICPRNIFQVFCCGKMVKYLSIKLKNGPMILYARFNSGSIGYRI